jgi:hypothetical protein
MPKLYENSFYRRNISTRRGVWTTWASPETWSSWLIRVDSGNLIDALLACECVSNVIDQTDPVLSGTFAPPHSPWSLIVETPHQKWATFADDRRYNESLEPLRDQFPGHVLTTGAIDDIAAFYVRLWGHGQKEIELVTDGMGWPIPPEDIDEDDEDDEDCRSIFDFFSRKHAQDWPHSFDRCEEAHQQIIIDLDAYVPHFSYIDRKLVCAYEHRDAVSSENIERVSLVTFEGRSG